MPVFYLSHFRTSHLTQSTMYMYMYRSIKFPSALVESRPEYKIFGSTRFGRGLHVTLYCFASNITCTYTCTCMVAKNCAVMQWESLYSCAVYLFPLLIYGWHGPEADMAAPPPSAAGVSWRDEVDNDEMVNEVTCCTSASEQVTGGTQHEAYIPPYMCVHVHCIHVRTVLSRGSTN